MTPFEPQRLRSDLPVYPQTLQLLRVTAATIPGPAGGVSAGAGTGNIAPTVLNVSSTQQSRTDTLAPRDREPCLVFDPNGSTLAAQYYLGRLCGNYNGLPVYEVVSSTSSGGGGGGSSDAGGVLWFLQGLTTEELTKVTNCLTPVQIQKLNNLDICQLRVVIQLSCSQMQLLTNFLTPTQIAYLVDRTTFTQLVNYITNLTTQQLIQTSSAYPALYELINQSLTVTQATNLFTNLTTQQISVLISLNYQQLQTVGQLTTAQQQKLTGLTQPQVSTLVGEQTPTELASLLDTLTTPQLQGLANNLTAEQIQGLVDTPLSAAQIQSAVAQLTPDELKNLTGYDAATKGVLVNRLSGSDTKSVLRRQPTVPGPILGAQSLFPYIPAIVGQPSSIPNPSIGGYAALVVDDAGNVYVTTINPVNNSYQWTNVNNMPGKVPSAELSYTVLGGITNFEVNVANTLRQGAGYFRVTWRTAFNDSNYIVQPTALANLSCEIVQQATTFVDIGVFNSRGSSAFPQDPTNLYLICWGNPNAGGGLASTCATPTFSPGAGSYGSTQSVTISTATPGATIRYTTDGSTPTGSSTIFTTAISVAVTTTIKAIAIKSGLVNSAVASATYTIGGGGGGSQDLTAASGTVDFSAAPYNFVASTPVTVKVWGDGGGGAGGYDSLGAFGAGGGGGGGYTQMVINYSSTDTAVSFTVGQGGAAGTGGGGTPGNGGNGTGSSWDGSTLTASGGSGGTTNGGNGGIGSGGTTNTSGGTGAHQQGANGGGGGGAGGTTSGNGGSGSTGGSGGSGGGGNGGNGGTGGSAGSQGTEPGAGGGGGAGTSGNGAAGQRGKISLSW